MASATGDDRVTPAAGPPQSLQPYLHELVTAVSAPAVALSTVDGQVAGPGAGFYLGDRRLLDRLVVTVDGRPAAPVSGHPTAGTGARFVGVVRHLGDPSPDPTVFLERDREVSPTGFVEVVRVVSRARAPLRCVLGVELGSDLADMTLVKAAGTAPRPAADIGTAEARFTDPDGTTVLAALSPAADRVGTGDRLEWTVALPARGSWAVTVRVGVPADAVPTVVVPPAKPAWEPLLVGAADTRLPALVARSLADLGGLLVADPLAPEDSVLTAGAPWYLTLFGRDSLWAARMALPLGTDLAGGTLRTLARRQGERVDWATGEEPGKILHEVRRSTAGLDAGVHYGTVDATPLWVSLLHDAWRWGLPAAEVEALLPHLERALAWLRDAAADGSGFIRYRDKFGRGPANQGWKDSYDSVQFADGSLAAAPIALCEVQAYAYAAARQGADLLDAFGRPGGAGWREWAQQLRRRFRDRFWVAGPTGPYPAIALDGAGRPVDTVSSNLGHLLGTGLLDDTEADRVVAVLAAPDMDCGAGLRTLSAASTGYNPLSYHGGSVWAHDTAIAVRGLVDTGGPAARAAASSLIDGLLLAASAFGYRLPELHGGESVLDGRPPLAYPAACRPQAWSAAAAVVLLSAVLGLAPDVPAGGLRVAPLRPSPVGELTVRGMRIGGEPLDLRLTADGRVEVLQAPSWLTVSTA